MKKDENVFRFSWSIDTGPIDRTDKKEKSISHFPIILKGGVGSGIKGHRTYRADVGPQMRRNLAGIASGKAKRKLVLGAISTTNIKDVIKNMRNNADLYTSYLAPDTAVRMRDMISSYEGVLYEGTRNKEFAKIQAKDLDDFGIDTVGKMIHQEIESNRQSFTDHGIRHIEGNTQRQLELMDQMGDPTAMDKLSAIAIMVNHDMGYTVAAVRAGGMEGIKATGNHKIASGEMFDDQKSQWNEDKIFTAKQFDRVSTAIKTHDSTEMSSDNLLTSTRISDNLALFAKEKLPSMFKYIKGGSTDLVKMAESAAKKDTVAFEAAKKSLDQKIDASAMNENLKRDLKAGTATINLMTPKFSMGVLAGEISSIKGDKKGRASIEIQYSAWDSFLQNHFDMGQKQTKKLLGDYGITDFTKTEYDIGGVLDLKVVGSPTGSGGKKTKEIGLGVVFKHRNHAAMGPKGGGRKDEGFDIDKHKEVYHVTRFEAAKNIVENDYFRTGEGILGGRGLSTTTDQNYWWGSSEVRFVLDIKKLNQDFKLKQVVEPIGVNESEVRVMNDSAILDAHKYITRIEYAKNDSLEMKEFIGGAKLYADKFSIPLREIIKKKSLGISTIFKGGPGSGNYNGPGDPRFAHEGKASIENLEGIVRDYITRLREQWQKEFPDEPGINDISYFEAEFQRMGGDHIPLWFDQIAKGEVKTDVSSPTKPYYSTTHGCYYNALAYIKTHSDVDLAYGAIIEKKGLEKSVAWSGRRDDAKDRPFAMEATPHAFVIDKKTGKVIDPTMGKAFAGDYYVYKKVPKEVVDKLTYKANDVEYDARPFVDYIDKEYKAVADKFDFEKFMGGKKSLGISTIFKHGTHDQSTHGHRHGGSFGSKTPVTQDDKDLQSSISQISKRMATNRRPEGWKNSSEYELVEKDGKFFTVAELPENLRTSKYLSSRVKECYRNAATLVLDNPDQYIYCEGFSTSFGIPMSHAWAVDNKTGKVVDPTWSSRNNLSPGKSYFGIAFSTDYLRKTIFDTGVWGLIPDYPTDNYNPMKDGFPDSAFHKKSFSVDKIDLDSIKDKPKDRNAYHYIEDYLIGGNVKAWGIYFKEGNANSGNHDHAGRPGHVGGSGTGGTRNKTDDEIRQNIQDQRLLASVYGDSNKKYELHFEGMTVADRLKFMEMNAKKESEGDLGDIPPEFAYTKYDFELQKEIPKGFNADQLRTYLKENNLIRDPKGVPDTFYPTFYLKGSDLTKGLSDAEKDEFIEEFPKSSKRAIDDGKYQVEISPDPEMGLSIKQWEKLSDNFDTASGYNGLKLKDGEIDWSDRMYLQKRALGEFSQDKEAALTALLSGWAMSGGGISAQKIIREVSAGLFPVNKGVLFYDSSEPGIDPGKKLYSKTRMAEHFAALKIETEDFYKKKFAKKSDPNPDLSMKTIDVWRGVGGHFDDYIPAAAESWSAQKSSADKFGKMTAQGGRSWGSRSEGKYTLVAAKISYNDVLWSYESVKGKYGWPSDKKLKGKKEFVVIGGALKLGNTTVENLYD